MTDVHYCDDYEAITGCERDGTMPRRAETKVITATEAPAPVASDVEVETKAAE